MKSYTVTQRVYCYDTFEEDEIPEGMTPAEFAEQRYCEEMGDSDSHSLLIYEDDTIIYDEEDATRPEGADTDDEPRCGAIGEWTDKDGFLQRGKCVVKVAAHIYNLHASEGLFWTNDYVVNQCDECSEILTDEEDIVHCPDGKIRCVTCVEAMYRENGGLV